MINNYLLLFSAIAVNLQTFSPQNPDHQEDFRS